MRNISYPDGVDCVWVASDLKGQLGVFVTGGVGPIPIATLSSEHVVVDDIEESLCKLPTVSEARLLIQIKRPDDFVALAERGLFVYDWRDIQRSFRDATHAYEPVAVPTNPIRVGALSENSLGFLLGIKLDEVDFSEEQPLNVLQYVKCLEGREPQ